MYQHAQVSIWNTHVAASQGNPKIEGEIGVEPDKFSGHIFDKTILRYTLRKLSKALRHPSRPPFNMQVLTMLSLPLESKGVNEFEVFFN